MLIVVLTPLYSYASKINTSEAYKVYIIDKSNKVILFSPARLVDESGIITVNIKIIKAWLEDVSFNLLLKDEMGNVYPIENLISYSTKHDIAVLSLETKGKRFSKIDKLIPNSTKNEFILNSINKYIQKTKKIEQVKTEIIEKTPVEPKIEFPKKEVSPESGVKEYKELAGVLLKQRKFIEAEENLQKALSLNSKDKETIMMMAILFTSTGRFKEAENLYKRAYEFTHSTEIKKKLASLYVISGQYNESIKYLQSYLKSNPLDVNAQFTLALAYHLIGDKESAFNQYINLKRIDSVKAEELFEILYR